MYKLTVVAGPNRGSTFSVQDGETTIGRQTGNTIILPSAKVSKRHCALVVDQGEIQVKDLGSSNGTFVNGVLARNRKVRAGDRISVGEFVFELSTPGSRSARPSVPSNMGNVVQFPGTSSGLMVAGGTAAHALSGMGAGQSVDPNQPPKNLKDRAFWFFDRQVMPLFYGINLKTEWKMICIAMFGVLMLFNLLISVYPLLQANRNTIVKETGRRAQYMARQIVERNAHFFANHEEIKADVGIADRAEGARMAVLIDMDNRIIAPASKSNQYLTAGVEGSLAIKARKIFKEGAREVGIVTEADETTVVAIEPVKVVSQLVGRNVVVAMAVVSLDTSIAAPDSGEIGMIYSETFIYTALLTAAILLVLYKMTLKPLEVLNDDIDKALKGEIRQVTHEFKFEELNSLWDVINSALQRIQRPGAGGTGMMAMSGGGGGIDEIAGPMRSMAAFAKFGMVLFDQDKHILFMNTSFEELSGIRGEASGGQELANVARDQALGPFSNDLFDRAQPGGEAVAEDFEFSGVTHKVYVAAFGSSGGPAKGFYLIAVKSEG